MSSNQATGRCACGEVRYRLKTDPIIVHCCHCSCCQRETGSAFVINALIEASEVDLLAGEPEIIHTPSASGRGQMVARCPTCHVALWSHYSLGEVLSFIRVGTLDTPDLCPPDVHIYTSTKQGWVILPEGAAAHEGFYPDFAAVWGEAGMRRRAALVDLKKARDQGV